MLWLLLALNMSISTHRLQFIFFYNCTTNSNTVLLLNVMLLGPTILKIITPLYGCIWLLF